MATVVNLSKDTRHGDLGRSLGQGIGGLFQSLMEAHTRQKATEAEKAALDPNADGKISPKRSSTEVYGELLDLNLRAGMPPEVAERRAQNVAGTLKEREDQEILREILGDLPDNPKSKFFQEVQTELPGRASSIFSGASQVGLFRKDPVAKQDRKSFTLTDQKGGTRKIYIPEKGLDNPEQWLQKNRPDLVKKGFSLTSPRNERERGKPTFRSVDVFNDKGEKASVQVPAGTNLTTDKIAEFNPELKGRGFSVVEPNEPDKEARDPVAIRGARSLAAVMKAAVGDKTPVTGSDIDKAINLDNYGVPEVNNLLVNLLGGEIKEGGLLFFNPGRAQTVGTKAKELADINLWKGMTPGKAAEQAIRDARQWETSLGFIDDKYFTYGDDAEKRADAMAVAKELILARGYDQLEAQNLMMDAFEVTTEQERELIKGAVLSAVGEKGK